MLSDWLETVISGMRTAHVIKTIRTISTMTHTTSNTFAKVAAVLAGIGLVAASMKITSARTTKPVIP